MPTFRIVIGDILHIQEPVVGMWYAGIHQSGSIGIVCQWTGAIFQDTDDRDATEIMGQYDHLKQLNQGSPS